MQDFGKRLKYLREAHQLTLREFSALTGFRPQTISDWERERRTPRYPIYTIQTINEALHIPFSFWCGGES